MRSLVFLLLLFVSTGSWAQTKAPKKTSKSNVVEVLEQAAYASGRMDACRNTRLVSGLRQSASELTALSYEVYQIGAVMRQWERLAAAEKRLYGGPDPDSYPPLDAGRCERQADRADGLIRQMDALILRSR